MLAIAETLRDALIPSLAIGLALMLALLAILIVQRLARAAIAAWQASVARRYQSAIDMTIAGAATADAIAQLRNMPRRHVRIVGRLLLAPLASLKGDVTMRAREAARDASLLGLWRRDLGDSAWWRRAEAALALGLLRDQESAPLLIAALDDSHQQVRAAAVDSLGRIGDPALAPLLLTRLFEGSRLERTRLVEALRNLGPAAGVPLLAHPASRPQDRLVASELLADLGGASAAPVLIEWTRDADPVVRAAAWRAVGAIGIDDRGYYHALRALGDDDAAVRGWAASAIGRTGRPDAADYLAPLLDDEWQVAAHAARALSRIGETGRALLAARAGGPQGHGRELARQLAWEGSHR